MKLSEVLQQTKDIDGILSFEETGRMIRAIKPYCDPISKYVTKSPCYLKGTYFRETNNCVGRTFYDLLTITINDTWNDEKAVLVDETPRYEAVIKILDDLEIRYESRSRHYIWMEVFPDINLGCFSFSDDPKVWRAKQDKVNERKKIKKVEKRLDRK